MKSKLSSPLFFFILLSFVLLFASCEEPIYTPKPRAYPRVIYPEKNYQQFAEDYCAFTFEYPTYMQVEQDTSFFGERPKHSCWFDLRADRLNAKIHCSYIPISAKDSFDKLRNDAFTMANEHIVKANYINEIPIKTEKGITGMAFDFEGPVASPFMFFLSDEKSHFFRGALYFNTKSAPDSLAPVVQFMKEDILHLINTFEWK